MFKNCQKVAKVAKKRQKYQISEKKKLRKKVKKCQHSALFFHKNQLILTRTNTVRYNSCDLDNNNWMLAAVHYALLQNLPFFGRCLYFAHWSVYCRQRKSVYHVKWINVPLSQSDNRNDTHITMYMPYHGVKANLKWPLKSQRLTILWDYSKLSFWIGLVLVCKLSKLWQNQK